MKHDLRNEPEGLSCSFEDLHTESDVEQKLLWPLLTKSIPNGAGLIAADLLTKSSIRRSISSRELYRLPVCYRTSNEVPVRKWSDYQALEREAASMSRFFAFIAHILSIASGIHQYAQCSFS
jgi:hypothetical protein